MDKKDLNQIYHYKQEIRMWEDDIQSWEEKLKKLNEAGLQSPKLDGMPRAPGTTDPTGSKAINIADIRVIIEDIQAIIEELEYKTLIKTKEIYEYMRDLNDSMMRQIIKYRCIELMTWNEVAVKIGGGNTADSVRMAYNRHIEKETSGSICSDEL